ncbi:hypothetical protein Dcar01_02398 [Deinococcus carri]|uniref:Phage tail tape measure protein domain-containing protein n=1 Tax=Deinococcus carri TaxID=1211323 RepID=A0ABP9W8I1_9DEIO
MTQVGHARFDVTADTAPTLKALRDLATQSQKLLGSVALTPKMDRAAAVAELKKATQSLRASVALNVKPLTQADLDKALGKLTGSKQVTVDLKGDAKAKLDEIKQQLTDLRTTSASVLTVDTSAVKAVITLLNKQIADLNALETRLRSLATGRSGGGGTGGQGGGSPGAGSSPYAGQLRALNADLKAGTLGTTQYEQAVRNLQAAIQGEITSLRSLGPLTVDQQRKLDSLRAAAGQAATALKGVTPAAGDGIGRLARELQVAQSQYERGATSLRTYLREMQRIQTAGQGMASGLQVGSREAQALERVMKGLSGATAKINDQSIVRLRSDLAGARAEFERATAAAGRFNFLEQRQATQQYEAALRGLETRIRAVGERSTTTQGQLRSLNQLSAQLGSQRNALNGMFTQVGLAGNVVNALKSLPQFAAQMGGSLGAAFVSTQQLTGGLSALAGAAGPVGLALGGVAAAVVTLTAGLSGTVGVAAQFQQTMVDIKALTQPTAAELGQLRQAAMDIGTPLGVGARDAATAILELNKAGLSAKDAIGGGLAGALTLAGAAGISAADGSRLAVAAMTAFGQQAKDLPQIADVFASFANRTFLSAEDLSQAIAAVGPVAKDAGLSLSQFAGYMASLAQGGFKNMSDAGTSLKTLLTSLQAPSDTAAGALAKLKVSFYDAAGASRPLGEVLEELRQKLASMSDQDRNNAIQKIFGSDAGRAARVFFGTTNAAIEENIRAMGLQGEAARVARERLESYAGQVKILKATWEQFVVAVGERLLPTLTSIVQGLTGFLNEVKRGGPIIGELRGYVLALAGALLILKANALGAAASSGWGALAVTGGKLAQLIPTLVSGLTSVAGAQALLNTAIAAGPGIIAAAVAGLAIYANKIMGDTARAYDQVDQGNQQSFNALMARVRALMAENTELSRAKAKYLLLVQQISDAQQGEYKGTKWTGERIYGPPDEARIKKLQADLAAARQNITLLTTEGERHAAASRTQQQQVQTALKLTDDQLKKQASTVKDLRAELAKPVKVFGGTEFQNQLDQLAEKYRQLREKLRQDVLDPKQRNELSRQLTARQGQEATQVRREYGSRAGEAAATAERQAQQARVNAMAEGSARIRAQAVLDIQVVRDDAKKQAAAWADFPKEKARILSAGEAQVRQIQAEANRRALEADRKAAEDRRREAQRQQREAAQRLREAQAVEKMGRQFYNLNQDFGLKVSKGSVSAASLQNYQQAVAGLRAEIEKLPQGQQDRFKPLFGQAGQLDRQGQALVKLGDQIAEVRGRVQQMTVAELEAARARWAGVPAAQALVKAIDSRLPVQRAAEYKAGLESLRSALAGMTDAELQSRLAAEQGSDQQGKRLKLIREEIEARRKLRDVTLRQGRLELQKGDAEAVVENYEARKAAAQGNATELLRIEQELGSEVLAARQRLAQVAAEQEIIQIQERYRTQIQAARKLGQDTTVLEGQQATAIQQVRDRRDALQLANRLASDKVLLDQARDTTAELVRLANERLDRVDAVERQRDEGTVGRYQLDVDRAGEDLPARLRAEQQWEGQVRTSRQDTATLSAQADIRAQTEKYRVLIEKAQDDVGEQQRLQTELTDWIIDRNQALGTELERIAFETAQARVRAEQALKDALLRIDRELRDGLNQRAQSDADRRKGQAESDLQNDLRAAGDNEEAKLGILRRAEVARIALSNQSINARMASERDAENRRFEDLRQQAVKDGTWASRREQLERDHQARLTEITTQGEYDKGQEIRRIRQETEDQDQRTQEQRAQDEVKRITKGLNDMTLAQRQAARSSLEGWLKSFRDMGFAGKAAAKVIKDALDQVADADTSARQRAVDLADKLFSKDAGGRFQSPEAVARSLSDHTGKIGKPDSIADAEAKGREGYVGEIESLKKGISDAQAVIDELGKVPVEQLDAQQALALRMAQQYLPIFQAQLGRTEQAATEAGQKAGKAFVDGLAAELVKAQDSAAEAGLQLAEANLKLAQSKGLPGTAEYNAALRAYRDYWQGRVTVLQGGLAAAQQAEEAARATLAGASTPEARAAAQTALTAAMANTAAVQGQLTQATTNYVNGQQRVLDSTKTSTAGLDALAEAQRGLDGVLGRSAISYQSEIQNLKELIEKYPEQAEALGRIRAEYERIQRIRAAGIATPESLKLDFQMGFGGGAQSLQNSVSGVAKGFGQLMNPLQLFSAILDKINPAGMILEGMFSVLEEPIKALQEPFKVIGTLVGSVLAPVLELIAPILTAVADLFVVLYDAIAAFVKAITFGVVNIDRRTPSDKKKEADKDPAQSARELADLEGENDLEELEQRHRQRLLSDRNYEEEKYKLTVARLRRERDAELAAAEGDAKKIAAINRKYVLLEEKERLDMLDRLTEAYRNIGETLMGSITGSVKDGLVNALNAGNFGLFRSTLRKNLREAMFEAVVSAAIETAAIKALLQPAIDALTAALQTPGTADDDAAIAGLLKAGDKVEGRVRQIYKALRPLRDAWGITGDSEQTQTMEVVGNVSAPEVRVSLDMLSYLADTIQKDVPSWRDAIVAHTAALRNQAAGVGATPVLRDDVAAELGRNVALAAARLDAQRAAPAPALPRFSTATDAFGLHEQAYQASVAQFGGHVDRFGGHVTAWGQSSARHIAAMDAHTRALAGTTGGFNPKR